MLQDKVYSINPCSRSEEGERGEKRERVKKGNKERETKGKAKSKFQDAVLFSLRNILP